MVISVQNVCGKWWKRGKNDWIWLYTLSPKLLLLGLRHINMTWTSFDHKIMFNWVTEEIMSCNNLSQQQFFWLNTTSISRFSKSKIFNQHEFFLAQFACFFSLNPNELPNYTIFLINQLLYMFLNRCARLWLWGKTVSYFTPKVRQSTQI